MDDEYNNVIEYIVPFLVDIGSGKNFSLFDVASFFAFLYIDK